MGKYYTKKKFRRKNAKDYDKRLMESAIDQTLVYLKEWKNNEVKSIIKSPVIDRMPIFIPIENEMFLIGYNCVRRVGNLWELHNGKTGSMHFFRSKLTAIIWTLCCYSNRHKLANEIISYEDQIIRLCNKQKTYNFLKKSNNIDCWKKDFYDICQQDIEYKLIDAKNRLQKSLEEAKYCKLWNHHELKRNELASIT